MKLLLLIFLFVGSLLSVEIVIDEDLSDQERSRIQIEIFPIMHKNIIYSTVTSPYTGRVWLDRNLGAKRVCKSFDDEQCYGDYYQWGRDADGHEKVGSSSFKTATDDWSSQSVSERQDFWMRTDGSSICPRGFRVPSAQELGAETYNKVIDFSNPTFKHFLKLPSAGFRYDHDGSMSNQGSQGRIWTTSLMGSTPKTLYLSTYFFNNMMGDVPSFGRSVRCIKD